LTPRPILFIIFINDLDDGIENTHSKLADDTKVGGVANTPDGYAAIQSNLTRSGARRVSCSSARAAAKSSPWGGVTAGTSTR